MSLDRSAAALLIALPIAFNGFFFLLGRLFEYPAVLRQPASVVLSRFHAGGDTDQDGPGLGWIAADKSKPAPGKKVKRKEPMLRVLCLTPHTPECLKPQDRPACHRTTSRRARLAEHPRSRPASTRRGGGSRHPGWRRRRYRSAASSTRPRAEALLRLLPARGLLARRRLGSSGLHQPPRRLASGSAEGEASPRLHRSAATACASLSHWRTMRARREAGAAGRQYPPRAQGRAARSAPAAEDGGCGAGPRAVARSASSPTDREAPTAITPGRFRARGNEHAALSV